MQHPFGALTRNFRLIRLRKFRGQQPAGPAGDGETPVASAKCLMSLIGHLLRPVGTSPPLLLFHKIHCGAVSIEKDKYMTPAHSLKTTRSSHSATYRRYQTYSDALKNSFFLRTIPHWNSLPPSVANAQSTEEFRALLIKTKIQPKVSVFFLLFCFFVFFVFLFYQNFQIRTPWCNAHV